MSNAHNWQRFSNYNIYRISMLSLKSKIDNWHEGPSKKWMGNKYMKNCSFSLISRELYIKQITIDHHLTGQKNWKVWYIDISVRMWKWKISCLLNMSINCYNLKSNLSIYIRLNEHTLNWMHSDPAILYLFI